MRKQKIIMISWLVGFLIASTGCQDGNESKDSSSTTEDLTTVEISTPLGSMELVLFDETPIHRDNFIKLIEDGFYNDLLFHRVIQGFMIQGGDPDSKGAEPGKMLGMGDLDYKLKPEFGKVHTRGALSAARMGDHVNPGQESSACQFFIVQGQPVEAEILNYFTQETGRVYSEEEIATYTTEGGRPDLDMKYTVFGQMTSGYETLEKIIAMPTDQNNRPLQDIPMQIKIKKK
jgi:cyclophilin family peptidyl-prolyl cis-trans isomerase